MKNFFNANSVAMVTMVTNLGLCAAAAYGMAKTKSVLPFVIAGLCLMTVKTSTVPSK